MTSCDNEVVETSEQEDLIYDNVSGFIRKLLDSTFGQNFSQKNFSKVGEKTKRVVPSSPAVKNGSIIFRQDGKVDKRSAAVKQGLVILDENSDVSKQDSVLCLPPTKLLKDNKVSKTSEAVKIGLINLLDNGNVDVESPAVLSGWLKLDESGNVIPGESILCQRRQLLFRETNGSHIVGFEMLDKITRCEIFLFHWV